MTPKLSKAVQAIEKLPQARQDAIADLLLEAATRAIIDDSIAAGEASFAEDGGPPSGGGLRAAHRQVWRMRS